MSVRVGEPAGERAVRADPCAYLVERGAVWLDMLWRTVDMMVFSLIAGCMWKRTGSLWAPALFHTANNLFIQIGL
ncbi:CPBP family intramembrane metalloprotease [Paenibacillus thiaminolyticus]|nr:CPBP family intramembrane metalloprotease [Paenibacillus thiaminolyticus]